MAEVRPKRHLKRRHFKDQKSAPGGYQEQNPEICLSNEREAPYMIVYVGICMDMSAHVGM